MNQFNTQKLISVIKLMRIILWALFAVSLAMIIVPWAVPSNAAGMEGPTIGWWLLSFQEFFPKLNLINQLGYSAVQPDVFLLNLTPLSWAFGFAGSFAALLPLLIGTIIMLRLTKNYLNGQIFNLNNTKTYTHWTSRCEIFAIQAEGILNFVIEKNRGSAYCTARFLD